MADALLIDIDGLQALIDAVRGRGYDLHGPRLRDGALVVEPIISVADLPRGVGDQQDAGEYRTVERGDGLLFGFAAPAQSPKPVFFPADELVWRGRRTPQGFDVEPPPSPAAPVALLGTRGCDLAAIDIQDRILAGRELTDTRYADRRAGTLIIAVACGQPAGTCFCADMGTGPKPGPGADLTLTEILDVDGHRFLVEVGTDEGRAIMADVPSRPAQPADESAADEVVRAATDSMGRHLDTTDLRDLLYANAESPIWAQVAQRCLACTNCTMVCPTCFCTSVEDVSDLSGDLDERHRVWDSCFSAQYSNLHGGAVRSTTAARYRQWLTHKLAAWTDQFGMCGCVGCGRCITWCPAGIDVTEEVAALRDADVRGTASTAPHTARTARTPRAGAAAAHPGAPQQAAPQHAARTAPR